MNEGYQEYGKGEPLVRAKEISYSYEPGIQTLKRVSVDLYRGEKIAVIGTNGAGKSTFFLTLNGVLTPDSGAVYYKDRLIGKKEMNELRRHVGIVFQDADSQIVASTVSSEISFGPVNLRLPADIVRQRVNMAISYMELGELANRPPHYLSGGEKKRVTIADIIAMEPEVIIFDEPASALDSSGREALDTVFQKLWGEGKTLVISTHDMDFAYRFAQRILVFDKGEIIADRDPVSLFRDEKILEQAKLKRPAVLDLFECLVERGRLKDPGFYPRTMEELKKIL